MEIAPQFAAVLLVQAVLFLAPLVALIWKIAGVVYQVKANKADIDNLGRKISEMSNTAKVEAEGVLSKITTISLNITELLTSLHHLRKDMDSMKSDLKDLGKVK